MAKGYGCSALTSAAREPLAQEPFDLLAQAFILPFRAVLTYAQDAHVVGLVSHRYLLRYLSALQQYP
jgi:hypothetical protein